MPKNILVTGLDRELGQLITNHLLETGNKVWGISASKTTEIDKLVKAYSTNFRWKFYDLHNLEDLEIELFYNFLESEAHLDGFVNIVEFSKDDAISKLSLEQLERNCRIKLFSSMLLTKFVIQNMHLHNTKGSIIHVAALRNYRGHLGFTISATLQGALEAFSQNCSEEWEHRGIKSYHISAGIIPLKNHSKLTDPKLLEKVKCDNLEIDKALEEVAVEVGERFKV